MAPTLWRPDSPMTEAHLSIDHAPGTQWFRSEFVSVWEGPNLELVCVSPGTAESWQWTCIGWRTPDDADGAEKGWVWAASREAAEKAALAFYMQKDD